MRQRAGGPLQPVKHESRFKERRVEGLAVEADQGAGAAQLRRHRFEERPFVGESRQEELPCDKRAVRLEPAAPDQERQRPGAAAEPGRFEVEEDERRPRRRPVREQRRIGGCLVETFRRMTNRLAAVARRRLDAVVDNEAACAPFAAQRRVQGRCDGQVQSVE